MGTPDHADMRSALDGLRAEVERLRAEVAELRSAVERGDVETSMRIAGVEQGLDIHESRLVHMERRSTGLEVRIASLDAAATARPGG